MSIDQIDTQDVFVPTDKGNDELKAGSTRLSPAALELLVLFDGKLNLGEVLARAVRLPGAPSDTAARREAQLLASGGYIELAQGVMDINIDFSYFFGTQPAAPTAAAVAEAGAEADAGARTLSLDGYYVSIARRAADRTRPEDAPPETVLVIEDDPEMQRMLRFLLTHAGFATRVAGNRAEIVTALRTLPSPDAVLLDVMLPDANGFDILARIRQHPVLKAIPVIMLTAKATREDVLRGLAGGADGYITKPFDHDTLMRGVRAVLGQH
jgi:two-component system OmpR family response regulator